MSLIQDALKKVQHERNIIQNSNKPEELQTEGFSDQNIFKSKKKHYIRLGLFLLLIIIISITTTLLIKRPVKINKNNFIINKKTFKTKKKVPVIIKQEKLIVKDLDTGKNTQNELIERAKFIKKSKDRDIKKASFIPEKIYKKQKKNTYRTKSKTFPVFKQKIELVSKKKRKKQKNPRVKKVSKFAGFTLKGEELYKQKKYTEAVSYFKKALKIKKNKDLYLSIYKCYKKTNNFVLLKAYTIDALENYKEDVFFNNVLGILLFREKNYSKALQHFELILQKLNRNVEILTYKGLCLFHLKRLEESLLIFKSIIKLKRNKIEPYYYSGLIYDNLKDYNSALDYYKFFEHLYKQQKGKNYDFKHHNWIRKRISLLERSMKK